MEINITERAENGDDNVENVLEHISASECDSVVPSDPASSEKDAQE